LWAGSFSASRDRRSSSAAWILDHGEGDGAHVGQLVREIITTGLIEPRQAERALVPAARRPGS
jgi:hypothetical protein